MSSATSSPSPTETCPTRIEQFRDNIGPAIGVAVVGLAVVFAIPMWLGMIFRAFDSPDKEYKQQLQKCEMDMNSLRRLGKKRAAKRGVGNGVEDAKRDLMGLVDQLDRGFVVDADRDGTVTVPRDLEDVVGHVSDRGREEDGREVYGRKEGQQIDQQDEKSAGMRFWSRVTRMNGHSEKGIDVVV
ncbi:hypothetical protein VTL71DRAFT_9958 [Oculimacula yallundae]|uniref:Uncharacterized protein n=1 Tax=Oculimacula yallundae TaxID=86028 RepID=A0ABR4BSR5_9HELO